MKTIWFKWGEIFPQRPYSGFNYTLSILKIQDLLSQDRLVSGKMTHVSISKKDVKNLYSTAHLYVILLFNTVVQAHWFPWGYAGEIRIRFHSKRVWVLLIVSEWFFIAWWSLTFLINVLLLLCYGGDTAPAPPFGLVSLSIVVDLVQIPDEVSTLLRVL